LNINWPRFTFETFQIKIFLRRRRKKTPIPPHAAPRRAGGDERNQLFYILFCTSRRFAARRAKMTFILLNVLALLGALLCGYHEYVRFQHAYEITDQQMLEHLRALQTSACNQETVRSVEYKGTVVDCNVLRIVVQRPVYQQAFVLWWHTGVWMDLWKRVAGNTAIVVFLLCVGIYVGFNAISSYWMTTRMQDMWFKISSAGPLRGPAEEEKPKALTGSSTTFPAFNPARKVMLRGASVY
jgi:hypothetical protein